MIRLKSIVSLIILACAVLLCSACDADRLGTADRQLASGDPEYEAQTLQIEGLLELDGGIAQVSVSELRSLPQQELAASYKRTTGLEEEFFMTGPLLKDVISLAGGDMDDYNGIGVIGRDNYYCLLSRDVIDSTPDLLLAVTVDGVAKLDDDSWPARLAVQGQFGPYWVKQVEKLVLYEQVPEKNIVNLWMFAALTEGIAYNEYEYYGSKDKAVDLEQVFSRLDYVDSKAFFTMKSADGFKKNEAMNVVKSRYYIKIEGVDAPTNVAPYIRLGMNVQKISWFSTNADAMVFPAMLMEYMDTREINGEKGIPLSEALYEVGVKSVKAAYFDLLGTAGERYQVNGEELENAILVPLLGGGAKIVWAEGYEYQDINNLQRIRQAGMRN